MSIGVHKPFEMLTTNVKIQNLTTNFNALSFFIQIIPKCAWGSYLTHTRFSAVTNARPFFENAFFENEPGFHIQLNNAVFSSNIFEKGGWVHITHQAGVFLTEILKFFSKTIHP